MDRAMLIARQLSIQSESEGRYLVAELQDIGVSCELEISYRAVPAVWIGDMGKQEIDEVSRECEREYKTIVSTRGWSLSVNKARTWTLEQLVGKLAVIRTRLKQLQPPKPPIHTFSEDKTDLLKLQQQLIAKEVKPIPIPIPKRNKTPESPPPREYSELQVGDLAQVCILSGKWAGNWVDCSIHDRLDNGLSFNVHVVKTNKYDAAVGQSGRIVEGIGSRFVRSKTTPRIKVGNRYLSPDVNGDIWPVTVLAENNDGTYTVQVHDGSFERQWRKVDEENILCPEPPRTTLPDDKQSDGPRMGTSSKSPSQEAEDCYVPPKAPLLIIPDDHFKRPPGLNDPEDVETFIYPVQAPNPPRPAGDDGSQYSPRDTDDKTTKDFGVQFTGIEDPSTPSSSCGRPLPPHNSPDNCTAPADSPASKINTAITLDTDEVELSSHGSKPSQIPIPVLVDNENKTASPGSPASKKNTAISLDTDEVNLEDL